MKNNFFIDFAESPRRETPPGRKNLFETEKRDYRMNHTPSSPEVSLPEWSSYLYWVNDGVAATKEDIIGPAIALKVEAGDTLYLETWAKFEKKVSYTRNATTAMMASLMGSAFVNSAFGLETFTAANQAFTNNLPIALAGTGSDPATRPFAYLNYMVFNESYVLQDAGAWRVPNEAGFDPGMEIPADPQLVAFPAPVRPQQKGYVYVWVSNESEATKVWFDDVKVTHRSHRVTQATDYYAFGSTLREQRTPEELTYRYGYQGQFAEKDEETGWNSFNFRTYDPIVGRWLSPDPLREFHSMYLSFGNDPVNAIDPDGRLIIFVNGFTLSGRLGVGRSYWGDFARRTSSFFGEDYDRAFFANGEGGAPGLRKLDGYVWADTRIETLRAEAIRDGRVVIASHSMGYAYALGIEQRLREENIDVDVQVTFAPFEYSVLNAQDTRTYLFLNNSDWVSGWKDKLKGTNVFRFVGEGSHSLFDFQWSFDRLDKFLPKGTVEVGEIIYGGVVPDGQ